MSRSLKNQPVIISRKLSEVVTSFDQYPLIKPEELTGVEFYLSAARGPYQSKQYADKSFVVFTVELTDDQGEIDTRNLILGYTPQGERASILESFQDDPNQIVGPVTLTQLDTGGASPFWHFIDPDELEGDESTE